MESEKKPLAKSRKRSSPSPCASPAASTSPTLINFSVQKRTVSPPAAGSDDGDLWDCSVCTFRNHKDAFKCSMCDVRKGTSTRKPRINPDLVAAQQAQALTPPPSSSSALATATPGLMHSVALVHVDSEEEEEEETRPALPPKVAKKSKGKNNVRNGAAKENHGANSSKKSGVNKARLKNVDRSSATYHSITVNDITVVITEFKPKPRKERPKKTNSVSNGQPGLKVEVAEPKLEVPEVKEATSPSPGTRTPNP